MYAVLYGADGRIEQRVNGGEAALKALASDQDLSLLPISREQHERPLEQTHIVRDGSLVENGNG